MMRPTFDSEDICADALCHPLFAEAERVRWRAADIPWEALDRSRVSPPLLALVREAAFSELTTHSATRRFLQEFSDDVDFTQWIAVWFYEESTHPQVLMQWLHHFGERCSAEAVRRRRQSTPFMRSRFGTLVTNVLSETVASQNYLALHRGCGEPVLAAIAKNLAADEARHARGFLAYARRMLESSSHPDLDRIEALKVLSLWFDDAGRVTHPVSELRQRADEQGPLRGLLESLGLDAAVAPRHACRALGSLLGLRIDTLAAAHEHLSELRARRDAGGERHAAT
jgi:ferritin